MATQRTNVYLIGPMGSGKTAVGKRLAALLGKQFLDSDAEIERRTRRRHPPTSSRRKASRASASASAT